MGDSGDPASDVRVVFLGEYTLGTLKLKPDKWAKCIGVEENFVIIKDFLEKPEQMMLILCVTPAGLLQPGLQFSPSGKTKAVYFIKRAQAAIVTDNVKSQLMFGDLSYSPLDQMSSLIDDVSIYVAFYLYSFLISRHANAVSAGGIVFDLFIILFFLLFQPKSSWRCISGTT